MIRYRKVEGEYEPHYVVEVASRWDRTDSAWAPLCTILHKRWHAAPSTWEIVGIPSTSHRERFPETLSEAKDTVESWIVDTAIASAAKPRAP